MIRLDKLLDVIGTDGNNKYVATKMNLESGDVIGTSFEISSNWVDEHLNSKPGSRTIPGKIHYILYFTLISVLMMKPFRNVRWIAPFSGVRHNPRKKLILNLWPH